MSAPSRKPVPDARPDCHCTKCGWTGKAIGPFYRHDGCGYSAAPVRPYLTSGYDLTHSPALEGCRDRVTALEAENNQLREALRRSVSALDTCEVSYRRGGGREYADYLAHILKQGRAALEAQEGTNP